MKGVNTRLLRLFAMFAGSGSLSFFFFFLKPLLNLLQYCFYFMSWFFLATSHVESSSPTRAGMEPIPPALEGRFLTPGPPGKSLESCPCVLSTGFRAWRGPDEKAPASLS